MMNDRQAKLKDKTVTKARAKAIKKLEKYTGESQDVQDAISATVTTGKDFVGILYLDDNGIGFYGKLMGQERIEYVAYDQIERIAVQTGMMFTTLRIFLPGSKLKFKNLERWHSQEFIAALEALL